MNNKEAQEAVDGGTIGERTASSAEGLPGYDEWLTDIGAWPGGHDVTVSLEETTRIQGEARERARVAASGECFCDEPVMRWYVCPVHRVTVRI